MGIDGTQATGNIRCRQHTGNREHWVLTAHMQQGILGIDSIQGTLGIDSMQATGNIEYRQHTGNREH